MNVKLLAIGNVVLLAALGVGMYFYFKPQPAPVGVHLPAKVAPEIARVATEPVELKQPLKVYKKAAKAKLKLPDYIQKDEAQHVVAASKTANDERRHTVTTLVDSNTGEVTTLDRVDPLPWLAVNTKSEVGIFYGVKRGAQAIRIQGQQEFLQIKAVHVGVIASADVMPSGVDTFVGVGAWARW